MTAARMPGKPGGLYPGGSRAAGEGEVLGEGTAEESLAMGSAAVAYQYLKTTRPLLTPLQPQQAFETDPSGGLPWLCLSPAGWTWAT